jgi:hypothetical protein
MRSALAPPFILAGLVLCAAGALKLRSPAGAASALGALGLPGRAGLAVWLVRGLAVGELLLGGACAAHPVRAGALALAGAYGALTVVALMLVRRRAACGCFGEQERPASLVQPATSLVLAAVALAAAVVPPPGLDWVLGRSAAVSAVLLVGIAGALYGAVLVYTVVPRAWGAWERA